MLQKKEEGLKMNSPVFLASVGALAGGFISLVGLLINYFLTRQKEDEIRRQEIALRHLERQMEELYSPLWGLLRQSQRIYDLARDTFLVHHRLPNGGIDLSHFSDQDRVAWDYLTVTYFIPLNAQMADLIRTKGAYLREKEEFPESFEEFLQHATQLEILHRLWKEKGQSTPNAPPLGWPSKFTIDIRETLDRLESKYFELIAGLKGKRRKSGQESSKNSFPGDTSKTEA